MKKIFIKLIATTIILFLFLASQAFAINPTLNDHKLINGIANIYYYVNSGASSYDTKINAAVNNWMYTRLSDIMIYICIRLAQIREQQQIFI